MPVIDLNSDLGEGMPLDIDDQILRLVSSANIACGGHAGDETSMRSTVRLALQRGVRVGAHPSYPDRQHFGRVSMEMSAGDLRGAIVEQTRSLIRIAEEEACRVEYVKPHGALYNDAAWDRTVGAIVLEACESLDLPLMMLATSPLAARAGITEAFIDRAVRPDGSLVPRSEPGALITDNELAGRRAMTLATTEADSLSVHSDTPGAPSLLGAARRALEAGGYTISAR